MLSPHAHNPAYIKCPTSGKKKFNLGGIEDDIAAAVDRAQAKKDFLDTEICKSEYEKTCLIRELACVDARLRVVCAGLDKKYSMRQDALESMQKAEDSYELIKKATEEVMQHMKDSTTMESCHDYACAPLKSCTCGKHGCCC